MCYYLRLASPLTLGEIRSMLPPGVSADALPTAGLEPLRALLPSARTAAHLRVGPCSCDLVRPRQADRHEDERHLRSRYAALRLPRDRIIRELERHRRGPRPAEPRGGWRAALAGFVAEHARNAGPTLYLLTFQPGGPEALAGQPLTRMLAEVCRDPGEWLPEGAPLIVVR